MIYCDFNARSPFDSRNLAIFDEITSLLDREKKFVPVLFFGESLEIVWNGISMKWIDEMNLVMNPLSE